VTGRATKGLRTAATVGFLGSALTAGFLVSSGGASPAHVPFSVTAPVETRSPKVGTAIDLDADQTVSVGPRGELGGGVSRPAKAKR
jgi:hypothetical protein